MADDTGIQWCDSTWNPVRGCSRVSPGCDQCYAMGTAHRFAGPGKPYDGLTTIRRGKVDWQGFARLHSEMLDQPLRWKRPRRIFVNSMSDLFHESLSNEEIAAVFGVMAAAPHHTFQVLTKRPERMKAWFEWIAAQGRELADNVGAECPPESSLEGSACVLMASRQLYPFTALGDDAAFKKMVAFDRNVERAPWPLPNVWLGVTAEDQKRAEERVPLLLETPAAVRFVSAEPLLGPIDFEHIGNALFDREAAIRRMMNGPAAMSRGQADASTAHPQLHWVIIGGESGHGARACDVRWIGSIVQQCRTAGVACFVKQLGATAYDSSEPEWRDGFVVGTRNAVLPLAHKKGADPSEWPKDLRVREFPEVAHG